MRMHSSRGFAWLPVVAVLAALALLSPSIKMPAFLQRQPPVQKLSAAEDELAKAKAAQAAAEAQLAQARAVEEAKKTEQLRYAQANGVGAAEALRRVPPEHATPEVKLARDLITRNNAGLAAAIGALPADQQEEMLRIVGQALSAKDEEVAAARAQLARKDAELAIATSEREKLSAELPKLQATVETKNAEVAAKEAEKQTLTHEVAAWAEKKADADRRAGSLDAYAGALVRILIGLGILYVIAHFALPSLAQEFPSAIWLNRLDKTVKSITSAHL